MGRKTFICPSTQRVSFSWMLRYQPLDISLIMMYKSPHSLTATNRLFRTGKKTTKKTRMTRGKKKTELTNVCAGQGADVRGFSLSLRVQATIHCKDQAKWTWGVFCFVLFFCCFLDLLYCNKECEL